MGSLKWANLPTAAHHAGAMSSATPGYSPSSSNVYLPTTLWSPSHCSQVRRHRLTLPHMSRPYSMIVAVLPPPRNTVQRLWPLIYHHLDVHRLHGAHRQSPSFSPTPLRYSPQSPSFSPPLRYFPTSPSFSPASLCCKYDCF